jgi:hypothetical protein
MVLQFVRACRVWFSIVFPASSPVFGSIPTMPETSTCDPALTPWLYSGELGALLGSRGHGRDARGCKWARVFECCSSASLVIWEHRSGRVDGSSPSDGFLPSRTSTGASSNAVEAVVSGLRRKMDDRAAALETVPALGIGLVRSTQPE